jgi:hypothetical protein
MPYICLCRSDIPESTLQVLDLVPNTSLRDRIYDPPGQTKYVSFQTVNQTPVGKTSAFPVKASQDITIVGTIANTDEFTVDTVAGALDATGDTYIAVNVPPVQDPLNQIFQFEIAGSAADTATNLAATINDFSPFLTAEAVGAVVTITAAVAGTAGNSVDLVATVETGGAGTAFTLGGATFANGTDLAVTTSQEVQGLAAYLMDKVENAGAGGIATGGSALQPSEALAIANALIAEKNAASALTEAAINSVISNTVSTVTDSGVGVGNSTATVVEILRILSGEVYTLPSGSQIQKIDANTCLFDNTVRGSFASPSRVRFTAKTGALRISMGAGHLSVYTSANFSYKGTTGRALVVYDDDGSVLA